MMVDLTDSELILIITYLHHASDRCIAEESKEVLQALINKLLAKSDNNMP
jgi:hypothetical protein